MKKCREIYVHNKHNYNQLIEYQNGGNKKSKSKKKLKRAIKYDNPGDEIVNFIENESLDNIHKNLYDIMYNKYVCDRILGQGIAGKVKISPIGSVYMYVPNTDKGDLIVVSVVIKDAYVEKIIRLWKNDNKLYVYSDGGLMIEAIILYYIRKLIKLKKSPHLPLILEHSACNPDMTESVDRIVTERHGLYKEIELKITGFYETPIWKYMEDYDPNDPVYYTRLATFDDLMIYINLKKSPDSDIIELPNGISCDITELIDYLTISYIVTCDLLAQNNVYLMDMHPMNIFINWLHDESYMHDEFIGKTEYIFYKRDNNKYYKIKTFGLLLKIGDVGASILRPQKNLLFIGQCYDIEKTHRICEYIVDHPKYFDFPMTYHNTMSLDTLRKTCAYKILSSYPYDKVSWMNQDFKLLENMPNPDELLKHFDKYSVNKIDETENYLVF